MLERLNDYAWDEAFGFAGEEGQCNYDVPVGAMPGGHYDLTPFTREDVAIILWIDDGANDEEEWIIAGILEDERGFTLAAGCDYTGFDCQAGGEAKICNSLEEMIRFGMDDRMRNRFGIHMREDV